MSKGKGRGKEVAAPKRDPNEAEANAIAAARASRANRPSRAQYVEEPAEDGKTLQVAAPHADAGGLEDLTFQTFGTSSDAFTSECLLHIANVTARGGRPSIGGLNASLAMIGAIAPENELEAALATQMAATHDLVMEMLRRTKAADTRDAMRDYGNLATKLSRTFTAQMKQLSDWRRGGEQVVRHVHVYEGGRAVVAETVNIGARNAEIIGQPHALGPALLGADPQGNGVPMPGSQGQAAMPDARRRSGKRCT